MPKCVTPIQLMPTDDEKKGLPSSSPSRYQRLICLFKAACQLLQATLKVATAIASGKSNSRGADQRNSCSYFDELRFHGISPSSSKNISEREGKCQLLRGPPDIEDRHGKVSALERWHGGHVVVHRGKCWQRSGSHRRLACLAAYRCAVRQVHTALAAKPALPRERAGDMNGQQKCHCEGDNKTHDATLQLFQRAGSCP